MLQNVGTKIRRVFFINGPNGPTDFFHGVVRSVAASNKYDVVYDDYDEEEMGEADFEIYKMKVKDQVVAKLANAQNARIWKDANDCSCAIGHCYHPWSKNTSGFNPKAGGGAFAADFRMQESSMRKTRSSIAPPDVDFYAAISSSHLMLNAVDLSDEIQGMISHAAMMSKRAKANAKLSAYDPHPMSLDACKKSVNWEYPRQGNSWKQAIMNEIENLKTFDVVKIIPLSSVPSGVKIFSIVTG